MPTIRTTTRLTPPPGRAGARRARIGIAGLAVVASLAGATLLTACGDSSDDDATTTTTEATGSGVPASDSTLMVEATDYAFADLPDEVAAGTRLHLHNTSEVELHELVAIRIPDEDTRSIDQLLADPTLATLPPATVLLATPGGEQIPAVGDGTLTEPGRYALICAIPTGIAPQTYLDAVKAANGAKPEIPDAAPPHLAHGMYAELVVT